jgi:hypothetical protein
LLGAATLCPTIARADDMPTRPERRESTHRPPPSVRVPGFIGGMAFAAGWWGIAAGTSYAWDTEPGMKRLRVPVVGPWMALRENSCQGSCTFSYYLRSFWFIFDGLAQAGGLGVALSSVLISTEPAPARIPTGNSPGPVAPAGDPSRPAPATPRDPGTTPAAPAPGKDLYWIPRPMPVGQNGFGLGVFGSF